MNITIDRSRNKPIYWQITDQFKIMIMNGDLPRGCSLPSERGLAAQLGVHRNTVIRAYNGLRDMELVEARAGVGYVVTAGKSDIMLGKKDRVNWSHIIKDEYQDVKEVFDDVFTRFSEGSRVSLSAGMPPFVYPEKELGRDIAKIIGESDLLPAYMTPYQGDEVLRHQLRRYLRTKGIQAGMGQIQVLSETNQALDFILAALVSPGDNVLIEEPCSPDVYRIMRLAGCNCITVPVDRDGMMLEALPELIERTAPKFIYVNSSYHDPTGNIMSMARREELLKIAGSYRIPIIEDDAASELYFEDRAMPTLKSMDHMENVIYIYSFQLTFIPGISLAVVVADEELIHTLSKLVSIRVVSISWITQKLLTGYLADGRYHRRTREIAAHARKNRDIMCTYLDRIVSLGVEYVKPRGGVYIWVKLPGGITGKEVAQLAARKGVAIMPGEVFFPLGNGGRNHIRLNYSYESSEWLSEGMEVMIAVVREMV